jgi:hypothetical protein
MDLYLDASIHLHDVKQIYVIAVLVGITQTNFKYLETKINETTRKGFEKCI